MKNSIEDSEKLADKLSDEEKDTIRDAVEDATTWMSENPEATKEEY
jgi:heat shock protein 5